MTREQWDEYCKWRGAFEGAIDARYYPMGWLDRRLLGGDAFFLCLGNSATAFEIKDYPTGARDIHALVAAGQISDIVEKLIPALEQRGRTLGCTGFLIESRPGWSKTLKPHGFEPFQLSVRKDL